MSKAEYVDAYKCPDCHSLHHHEYMANHCCEGWHVEAYMCTACEKLFFDESEAEHCCSDGQTEVDDE